MGIKMQVLELPYKGDDLSMIVLLPELPYIRPLEADLSVETLKAWTSDLKTREVDVFLPKFKMTYECLLNKVLSEMGMPIAFSETADFSGIDGTQELHITAVLHKAFVEVNEEGTEAAAATGVVVGLRSIPAPPPTFRADHPFVFLIKENSTGSILFMGRVADPTKE